MKVISSLALLVCATQAHKLSHKLRHQAMAQDDSLDELMDKYDNPTKDSGFKPSPSKIDSYNKGGPSAAQVSDVELQILQGTYTTTNSDKAELDDELGEVLEKYGSTKKDEKVLTRNDATEAAVELMEQRHKAETMDAMEGVRTTFAEVWKSHDISEKGFIDFNEGYSLMQDLIGKMN